MRKTFLVLALLAALTLPLFAVGTATVTTTQYAGIGGANRVRYAIAWTSTAGGAVSGNAFSTVRGKLILVKFMPSLAGTQPDNLYDITIVDTDSVDLLNGAGANLSNAAGAYVTFNPPIYLDGTSTLDLVIANAGASKTGTVYIWVEQ